MAAVENLDKLAEEIYRDGIEKAEQSSKEMLEKAKMQADEIIQKAKLEADRIIQNAEKDVERQKEAAKNVIKVNAAQAISDLQERIKARLLQPKLNDSVSKAFEDPIFVKELISTAVSHWAAHEDIAMIVTDKMKEDIKGYLENELNRKLPGFTCTFSDELENGFVIEQRKDGYFLTFNDEDFKHFFAPYFSLSMQQLLFEESP